MSNPFLEPSPVTYGLHCDVFKPLPPRDTAPRGVEFWNGTLVLRHSQMIYRRIKALREADMPNLPAPSSENRIIANAIPSGGKMMPKIM